MASGSYNINLNNNLRMINGMAPERQIESKPQLDTVSEVEKNEKDVNKPARQQWSKGIEFLLSCISMSVGLGNVWRFPYAAYKNGGGAFLIPYLILLIIIGRPMYYFEMVLGQFSGRGNIKVWKCVPALKGLGYAQLITLCSVIIFYNYLMALTLYYLFSSMASPLPWTWCDPDWCRENLSDVLTANSTNMSYAEQFFKYNVLHQADSLVDISYLNWKLALCLLCAWCVVYLCIVKGVSSLGKTAYFTALFPYVILIALLIIGLQQPGAFDGIIYFFKPDWKAVLDPIVWYNAVQQSFFSLAVCFGTLVMYSGYNNFHNNVYRDAIIISVLDTFTSILAGCVIFGVLGAMAKETNKSIDQVAADSMGLAFVVYPDALSRIKVVPQLWSVLFFVMLFVLGIGSSTSQIETVLTALKDQFTSLRKHTPILAAGVCLFFFVAGLPLTTDAGLYIMSLMDYYGSGTAVFLYGILQTVAVMWIYGFEQFCDDAKFMLKRSVGYFWKATWGFITPIALAVIFIYGNFDIFRKGRTEEEKKQIPDWGNGIGWFLAALALIQIPLWFVVTVMNNSGTLKEKLKKSIMPEAGWGPTDPKIKAEWIRHNRDRKGLDEFQTYRYINPAFVSDKISDLPNNAAKY